MSKNPNRGKKNNNYTLNTNNLFNRPNTGRNPFINTNHTLNQNEKKKLEAELNKRNEIIKSLNKEIEKLKDENSLLRKENEQLKKAKYIHQTKKEVKQSNEEEFPKGEHYYHLIKDTNINPKQNNNIISEKIQIYFSLNNVFNQNSQHSFKISIINNKKIGNIEYLGSLENKTGNNIKFGTSFQIDYFFQAEQILIIEPKLNEEETGERIEYPVCNLMKNEKNIVSIKIKNIGTLQIDYINLKNEDAILRTEISTIQFGIKLYNTEVFETKKLQNVFFIIKNHKDGKAKREVYKSDDYEFELNKKSQTSLIRFESNILCGNKKDLIFFELYYPSLDKRKMLIGEACFNLYQLESYLKEDNYGTFQIQNKDYGIIGELEIDYNVEKKLTFEQFIKKGTINLDIAIYRLYKIK